MIIFGDKKFTKPLRIIKAFNNTEFIKAFQEIENLKNDYYIAGYIRYEAKNIFLNNKIQSEFPLLYFEVFDRYEEYKPISGCNHNFISTKASINFEEYKSAIEKIKDYIAEGETYQVNYTYDSTIISNKSGLSLYEYLLENQKTPYNFYTKNEYDEILSFSPELFFEIENNIIKTKPMKGTVKRGLSEADDIKNIRFLQNDQKNRAENVMIVDLLRNDLGKIAEFGTVKVEKLFEIETHKTVHQMTSEITAKLKENTTLFDIFEAIFPCGSITGAPKISTMKIIEELEKGKRDIYCGAIGLISHEKTVFSVPIRILRKTEKEKNYRCRAGGAIVWDSDTLDEWDETKIKLKFLTPSDFQIIETAKVENGKILYAQEHFTRLKNSAIELGFTYNTEIENITPEQDGMIRILLNRDGCFNTEYHTIHDTNCNIITISGITVNSEDIFLKHKTTFRPYYETAMQRIKAGEVYDEIFFNEKGELTEGARSNIIIEKDGKFYTPPLQCGLLNGIMRIHMSKDLTEKIITKDFLKNAASIYCINSVRGMRKVVLDDTD